MKDGLFCLFGKTKPYLWHVPKFYELAKESEREKARRVETLTTLSISIQLI